MTTMLLSRLHYPVRSLGYGRRAGIWFQGCTVYCKGCISRDTWLADESMRTDVDDVLAWLQGLDDDVDGVTVSGGEPTDQPAALNYLLDAIDEWRRSRPGEIDILVYSGRDTAVATTLVPRIASAVDVLVSGPYMSSLAAPTALRGSSNQVVETFSELGYRRYAEHDVEVTYGEQRREIGVHVDDDAIWMVGIPLDGDMSRLRSALAERGIVLDRTSWLS